MCSQTVVTYVGLQLSSSSFSFTMNLLIVFTLETCKSKKSKTQREERSSEPSHLWSWKQTIFDIFVWQVAHRLSKQSGLMFLSTDTLRWRYSKVILLPYFTWNKLMSSCFFDRQEFGSYSVSDKCSQLVSALTLKSLPVDVQTSLLLMYQHLSLMTDRWSGSFSQTGELLSFKPPSSLHIILIIIIRQVEPPLPNPLHQGH